MKLLQKYVIALALLLAAFSSSTLAKDPDTREVLLFGDSIAAGFGLSAEEGLTAQLEARLLAEGLSVDVKNAGVSGDTTAGGLSRLDWALTPETDVIVLILGGNDALRGLTPSQSRANLDALLTQLKTREVKVLLTGMRAPPNLGADYAAAFEPMFSDLAEAHGVAFYPFILEGVAAETDLNQADGIHPNGKGVGLIVEGLLPLLKPLLDDS